MNRDQQFQADISANAQAIQTLMDHVANLQLPQAPSAPPAALRPRIFMAYPDKFTGDRDLCQTFINQCQLFIANSTGYFPNDDTKVAFMISLLSGRAARWASPFIEKTDPVLRNFPGFCQLLQAHFTDPLRERNAISKLRRLYQGARPVADYVADFRETCAPINWNEGALMEYFQDGLAPEITQELLHHPLPATLNELYHLCMDLETRLHSTRARLDRLPALMQEARTFRAPRRDPQATPAPRPNALPQREGPIPTAFPRLRPIPASREEPMDLGATRPRLSETEKARRRAEGLCWYCGEKGHLAIACPRKRRAIATPAAPSTSEQQARATRPENEQGPI